MIKLLPRTQSGTQSGETSPPKLVPSGASIDGSTQGAASSARSGFWSGLKLKTKVPVLIAVPTFTVMLIGSAIGYYFANSALAERRENLYTLMIEDKAEQISNWLHAIDVDTEVMAESVTVQDSLVEFSEAFSQMTAEEKQSLGTVRGETGGEWTAAYKHFHPEFEARVKLGGYGNIYLMNLDGDVVYSAQPGVELGLNATGAELSGTGLNLAYEASKSAALGDHFYSKIRPYKYHDDKPTKFGVRSSDRT